MAPKRQRGVRVSPIKLRHALAESGLKTQTAVAERIADDEQLESVPRGLVNKVFRGESVDPRSVERIAKALGVEAWTLYASGDDPVVGMSVPATASSSAANNAPGTWRIFTFGVIGIVLIAVLAFMLLDNSPDTVGETADTTTTAASTEKPRAQQPTAMVLPIESVPALQLDNSLAEQLNQRWRVLPLPNPADGSLPDAQELLRQGLADRVLEGRTVTQGRWLGITWYVHQPGAMQAAWQGVLPLGASAQRIDRLMQQAARQISAANALPGQTLDAQVKYLTGREFLDRARTELNVRRALTEFESALRMDPAHVNAYAGLCEALVMEQIRTGDVTRLTEAESQCRNALELDSTNLEALRTQAYLDRKRGRINASWTGYDQVLKQSPDNVDALLGMADVYVTQYQMADDGQAYAQALATVRQAHELEPEFWKTAFSLARIEYFGGNLAAAVAAAEHAVRMDSNLLSLSNLGTYQFCQGDFAAARDAYQQIKTLAPMSFVGEQQLAAVNYNLGDFDAAVTGFKNALDLHQQSGAAHDHRVWGNYADALRHANAAEEAAAAYAQAISLAEKAINEGDANPQHNIARAYYYEMLSLSDPRQTAQLATPEELETLSETADPIYLMFLAIIYQQRGLSEYAETFRAMASQGCPGIAISPDYVSAAD